MNNQQKEFDLLIGLGEVGKPVKEIFERVHLIIGKDLEELEIYGKVRVLHICYPYRTDDFITTTVDYINQYKPELTIVHSTIIPGTINKIYKRVGGMMAYSPVRGKHTRMLQDLLQYTKFIAGTSQEACELGAKYLSDAKFKTKKVEKVEALELAKIIETTYFGMLLAWAQEVERIAKSIEVDYEDALLLTEDVSYLPPVRFQPGYIGGHCIMPNIELLGKIYESPFLELIKESNEIKKNEWLKEGKDLEKRLAPKQID